MSIPAWGHQAACRDEDPLLFYGPDGEGQNARRRREALAKAVCARCPAVPECLDYAIGEYRSQGQAEGIWGGMNQAERDAENKRRLRAAQRESAA